MLGYLGEVSKEKLASPEFAGYRPGDQVGVTGAEAVFEHELVGTDGIVKYRVNSLDENLGQIGRQDWEMGNDVYLTLDADTQTARRGEPPAGDPPCANGLRPELRQNLHRECRRRGRDEP